MFSIFKFLIKKLWNVCASNPARGISQMEFKKAMRIVYDALYGGTKSTHLPQSPVLGDSISFPNWTEQEYHRYGQHFDRLANGQTILQANIAANFFAKSKLPTDVLKQIWFVYV